MQVHERRRVPRPPGYPVYTRRNAPEAAQPDRQDPNELRAILHADDCGLSAGITDGILACYDAGCLHRTSLVANGAAWTEAVAALRERPGLDVVLHLNLFEGRPVSDPSEVDLLVDRSGRLRGALGALCASRFMGARGARLRAQIGLELRRQIERHLSAFGDRPLTVDGHVHYHMFPPIFDELLGLTAEYPIGAVRLPREPLYWPAVPQAPRPRPINLVKNLVLRALCARAAPALAARSIASTDAFIGVLGTGEMTLAHVRAGLQRLRAARRTGTVEVLFHPGRARADEAGLWDGRPELQAFYLSPRRDDERHTICSGAFAEMLGGFGVLPGTDRTTAAREVLH